MYSRLFLLLPFLFAPFNFLAAQCQQVLNCPPGLFLNCDNTPNAADLWNEPYWLDPVHNLPDLCEAPLEFGIAVRNTCGRRTTLRYELYLDLDRDGVQETLVDSRETNPANTVYFGNIGGAGYTDGVPRGFDERAVPGSEKYFFGLLRQSPGPGIISARVAWRNAAGAAVPAQLPHGLHRLLWIARSGAEIDSCSVLLQVGDCLAPSLLCLNGSTVAISPDDIASVQFFHLVQSASDNCTPAGQLEYSLRRTGDGTGFPLDAQGQPVPNLTYSCAELGVNLVEVWVRDQAGNTARCETYFLLADPANNCND